MWLLPSLICLTTVHERNRQTDRQTDRQNYYGDNQTCW